MGTAAGRMEFFIHLSPADWFPQETPSPFPIFPTIWSEIRYGGEGLIEGL